MRERILEYLGKHPEGERLTYISSGVKAYKMDVLDVLIQLKREGLVESINQSDPANMEYYILYKKCLTNS